MIYAARSWLWRTRLPELLFGMILSPFRLEALSLVENWDGKVSDPTETVGLPCCGPSLQPLHHLSPFLLHGMANTILKHGGILAHCVWVVGGTACPLRLAKAYFFAQAASPVAVLAPAWCQLVPQGALPVYTQRNSLDFEQQHPSRAESTYTRIQ